MVSGPGHVHCSSMPSTHCPGVSTPISMLTVAKQFNNLKFFILNNPHSYRKDKLKEIPKAGHRPALGMKLQKQIYLIKNSQAVKKGCSLQKSPGEKRCEIQGGSQEMAVIVL